MGFIWWRGESSIAQLSGDTGRWAGGRTPTPSAQTPCGRASHGLAVDIDVQDTSELLANPRESGGWSKATQQGPTVDCCLVSMG